MNKIVPRVLTIAGSDSGGAAGIQADLKTFTALGVYGTSVITSITAQNTCEVLGIEDLSADFVELQIDAVLKDLGTDAVKLGMLSNESIVISVAKKLKEYGLKMVVLDPVMITTSGVELADKKTVGAIIRELLPLSYLVMPNIPEAESIAAQKVESVEDMKGAAQKIKALGAEYVLIKGGHLKSPDAVDVLYDGKDYHEYSAPRVGTKNTHGGGCTYSAAICANLAKGISLELAVKEAKQYVTEAIESSFDLGQGSGPLNHFWKIQ